MKSPTKIFVLCGVFGLALALAVYHFGASADAQDDATPQEATASKPERKERNAREARVQLTDILSRSGELPTADSEELRKLLNEVSKWGRSDLRFVLEGLVEGGFHAGENAKHFSDLLTIYSKLDAMDALRICDEAEAAAPFLSGDVFPYDMVMNAAELDPYVAASWTENHKGKFGSMAEQVLLSKIVKYAAQTDPALGFQILESMPTEGLELVAAGISESADTPEQRRAVWEHFRNREAAMEPEKLDQIRKGMLKSIARKFRSATEEEVGGLIGDNGFTEIEVAILRLELARMGWVSREPE